MSSLALQRHNIKTTRDQYSQIHNLAAAGREVLTVNTMGKGARKIVSHIDKSLLDFLFEHAPLTLEKDYDAELQTWTLSIVQADIYGEGPTEAAAAKDLINSTLDYIEFYYANLDFYQGDTAEKKAVMAKLARCEGNPDSLRAILGI